MTFFFRCRRLCVHSILESLRSTTRKQLQRHKFCIFNEQKQNFCTLFTCFFNFSHVMVTICGLIAVASKSENNCSQADIFRTKFTNQTLSDQLLVLLNESCVGKNQMAQLCICLLLKPSQSERIDCDFSFFLP